MENNIDNYTKEELLKWFTTDNKSGHKSTEKWLSKHQPLLCEKINKNSFDSSISFIDKILIHLNEINEIPKCLECNNKCKNKGSIKRGLAKFCSSDCSNKSELTVEKKITTRKSEKFINNIKFANSKRAKTFQEKYGVDNPSKLPETQNKLKKTNLKKFGVECVFQSEEIKEKIKKRNIEKYGVEHLSKDIEYHKIVSNKIKETCEIKFGKILSSLLNISVNDIEVHGEMLTIKNYCKYHDEFKILKNNFSSRILHNSKILHHSNICTKCYPIGDLSSISENELFKFIECELMLITKKHHINKIEIDIFVEEKNVGFEYDGLFWHSEKYRNKKYHINKTNLCKLNNINLIHIFEDEWLFKKEIVKSIIKNKLGIIENKIFAQKCVVKLISNKLCSKFLENNHIQGDIGSKIKLGLYYENELISIMTFRKKRNSVENKIMHDDEYEMLRFCDKLNTTVIDGVNKLLNYFIETYNPNSIITFADRRYSNGDLYEVLGFIHVSNTEPNYFYFKTSNLKRYSRSKSKKNILVKEGFDPNKTEHQIMNERGYLRIYDCGQMKFELKLEQ